MAQTAVDAHTLHALKIFAELDIDLLADVLVGFAILVVTLSVEEPGGDVELLGVGDDAHQSFYFLRGQLTGALGKINFSLSKIENA